MIIRSGMVLRHYSGRIYTVVHLTNIAHPDQVRVPEAVLLGANGNWWTRPLDSFAGKFTVLFDGVSYAP